jgi:catechol 2,3-dioxygenase-like lactoylglutathione lyase family enzyme
MKPRLQILVAIAVVWMVAAAAFAGEPSRTVDTVAMTVADMDRSVAFYTQVLTFARVSEIEVAGPEYEHLDGVFGLRMRIVRLRLGDEYLTLIQYLAPRGRPFPVDSRANDRWFQHVAIVVSDMESAYGRLRKHKVEYASTGPQTLPAWNRNAGGIRAFYFRDPDEHYLELIQFPPGKGNSRWQHPNGQLFMGIDHSAIVVGDTDTSLRFYRDLLGLRVAGGSENYGTEQEHLNNVFGARLRITSLRAAAGPGVELLEYLAPRDGRPIGHDVHPNDLVFWRIVMAGPLAPVAAKLNLDEVATPRHELGFNHAALIRDPDGHATELIER